MKRGKKLMGLLAVLVALIGATLVATSLNPEKEETEEETGTVVFTLDGDSVTALSWDYSEELEFVRDGDWEYAPDAAFPLDESYIDAALSTLAEVTSFKTIEGAENLDQYGLEVPICTITVTAEETYTLAIGEETSMGGQRYFSTGDGNVYLVDESVMDPFSYGLYDLLKLESIPSMTEVVGMTLDCDTQSYEITYREDSGLTYADEEYVWYMGDTALDTELTQALLETVTDLSWTECVDYNATDLSAYGLDDPMATVTIRYIQTAQVDTGETDEEGNAITEMVESEESFTLEMGGDGEDCYARIAGSSMVYQIDEDISDTLLYTTVQELLPDEVLVMDWEEVTAVDVTLDGETYEITKSTKTVTDDEGTETEETIYLLDGEEVDFDSVISDLDGMTSVGYATGMTPERTEEIHFTIHRERESSPVVELAFYQYDSTGCITLLNGEATVMADREAVVDLVEAVNARVLK